MSAVSPWAAVVAVLLAWGSCQLLVRRFGAPPVQGRFVALDGLRGCLAYMVFLSHAALWHFFAQTGRWEVAPSALYAHFGQSSVIMFFMITGLLFFSKLLDARHQPLDWAYLFLSRLLRLTPLYALAVALLLLTVWVVSQGRLNVTLQMLVPQVLAWLVFTIPGAPDVNGVPHTAAIVSGVTWALPYEWLFYVSLPAMALVMRVKVSWWSVALSGLGLIYALQVLHPYPWAFTAFFMGMLAAVLVRLPSFRAWAVKPLASGVVLLALALVVILFPTAYKTKPMVLLGLAFALIAAGNHLFGFLTSAPVRYLGQMAYSVYLLHGLVLYAVLALGLGWTRSAQLSDAQHWLVVWALIPLLLMLSAVTCRWIEQPAMHSTARLLHWWREGRLVEREAAQLHKAR